MMLEEVTRSKPRRFLEVAANDGWLSACAAQSGCDAVCNDLRSDELKAAMHAYTTGESVTVVGGSLFDLHADTIGKFDFIAACEIIEHVAHPDQLLAHLKSLLVPGGRLLMTTPNGRHLRNKLPTHSQVANFNVLEARQFQPDADGHLFLFTPHEFARLAKHTGYAVEHLSVWGTPLLTGHYGLGRLARPGLTLLAYGVERIVQRLPLRERLCFSLFAILRKPVDE